MPPPQGSAVQIARVFGDDGGIPVRLEAGAAGTGERQAYIRHLALGSL